MKTVKKANRILALLLAFAMVVSGIYFVKPEGSEAKAETTETQTSATVEPGMLNVKIQPGKNADGTVKALRFVSSVNSLNYRGAGFEVYYEGIDAPIDHEIYEVYERIESVVNDDTDESYMEYQFSPKVVDTSSEYFMTAKLDVTGKESTLYTVKAYVIPFGSNAKVYGPSRCVSFNDCYSTEYASMSFVSNVDIAKDTKIDVTSTEYKATVIGSDANANGGYNIHVQVDVDPDTLPSATKFTFGTYGDTVYRNLYTEYKGTAATKDTSWYNIYDETSTTEYVIATSADLYGFQTLVNTSGKVFANKTVYMVSDIAVNPTTEGVTAKEWAESTTTPSGVYPWAPIGSWDYQFAGRFDGQMHQISGIYLNATGTRQGFFAIIGAQGEAKNFYIKESLFKTSVASGDAEIGSVVGRCYGNISTIFSDAIVVAARARVGGMIGWLPGPSGSVSNCWFDGEICNTGTGTLGQTGGIVGYMAGSTSLDYNFDIKNCAFTGKLSFYGYSSKWALRIGGIAGGTYDGKSAVVNIENCISAGEMTQAEGNTNIQGASTVFGGFDEPKITTLNLVNVYGTEECFTAKRVYHQYHANTSATGTDPTIIGAGLIKAETDLQGVAGYQKTLLDFEDTWIARQGDVPALKAFDEEIESTVDLTGYEQDQWYDANEIVFGIGSAAALKSLSTYVNDNAVYFKDKTIYLTDDIEVNKVEEGTLAAWKAGTGTRPTSWEPIGFTAAFNGTFDGRMHTISGVYMKEAPTITSRWNGYGLFGKTGPNSIISNLLLVDSYFEIYDSRENDNDAATGGSFIANLGSIVGSHQGTLTNVYSNATIASNRTQVGGIMGFTNAASVSNVWYDGTITLETAHGRYCGGIIGYLEMKSATCENLLFTGTISYNTNDTTTYGNGIGGIIGVTSMVQAYSATLKNAINAGSLVQGEYAGGNNSNNVGSVVGFVDKTSITLENVYASTDFWNTTHNIRTGATGTLSGPATPVAEAELYGDSALENAEALDYTSTWETREDDVPVLQIFADMVQ